MVRFVPVVVLLLMPLAAESVGDKKASPKVTRQKIGDLYIRIHEAHVTHVPLRSLGQLVESEEKMLIITVAITNLSQTKKIKYRSWSSFASLVDDLGNVHERPKWKAGTSPAKAFVEKQIMPEATISDDLIFDAPVNRAKWFYLKLPLKSVGQKGSLDFTMSRNRIGAAAE